MQRKEWGTNSTTGEDKLQQNVKNMVFDCVIIEIMIVPKISITIS